MLNTVTDLKVCKDSARVNRQFTGITRLLFTLIILLWTGGSWLAAETRVVTADPSLAAGPVKRLLLGADYRDLDYTDRGGSPRLQHRSRWTQAIISSGRRSNLRTRDERCRWQELHISQPY